ncbi:MAG: hypothetical protein AAFX09_01850 [Pseudomonadota bacterium]
MIRVLLCLMVAGLALSGCARLSVQVDVADGDLIREAAAGSEERRTLFRYLREADDVAALDARITALQRNYGAAAETLDAAYSTLIPTVRGNPAAVGALNSAQRSVSSLPDTVRQQLNLYRADAIAANQRLEQAYSQADAARRLAIEGDVRTALNARKALDAQVINQLDAEVAMLTGMATAITGSLGAAADGDGDAGARAVEAAVQTGAEQSSARARDILQGGSLASSDYAYYAASLPDTAWETDFNRAYGRGTFGDSDVVIRMNSVGDFSVKGMTFDPSTVAAVASKVSTQAILLGAQIAGAPVHGATAQGASGIAASSNQLEGVEARLRTREAQQDAWRQAILDLASVILTEQSALVPSGARTDAQAEAARAAATSIDDAAGAYEPVLKMSAYGTPPS